MIKLMVKNVIPNGASVFEIVKKKIWSSYVPAGGIIHRLNAQNEKHFMHERLLRLPLFESLSLHSQNMLHYLHVLTAAMPLYQVGFYGHKYLNSYLSFTLPLKEHVALDRSSWFLKSVCNRLL